MTAEPLVEVRCAACKNAGREIVASAAEIEVQLRYLRHFHRRRLRADAPASALADRADFTQDYATDLVACTRCGLLFRDPRPTNEAIERAYAADRYGRERLESLFVTQLPLYRRRARALSRWLRPGARVVEVGSFAGAFLAAGKERGWEILGIDPGEEVSAFCAERGLQVFRGTLADAPLPPCQTDCVAILNTFDQLPDPEPVLEAARRLLRPSGLLAVRVPNGDCFRWAASRMLRLPPPFAGWLRAAMAWNNLLAFPYLFGYSVDSLDRLLTQYGLERLTARPDTLPRLSDAQTKPWAWMEERVLKRCWRLAARVDAIRPEGRSSLSPWFDAYYRPTMEPG